MPSATTAFLPDVPASAETLRIRERLRKLKAEGKPLTDDLFHFAEAQEMLKHVKGNLSDLITEERDEW